LAAKSMASCCARSSIVEKVLYRIILDKNISNGMIVGI